MNISEVRANLYIEEDEYNNFWNEIKKSVMQTLNSNRELLSQKDVSYCFESDLQFEIDYMEECETELQVIKIENGIAIYKLNKKSGMGVN